MTRRCPSPRASRSPARPSAGPPIEYAPTDAKAACHYPNSARAIREAKARGFDNAVMLDPLGHVAELATANIWFAKNGEAHTPVPNGTFLNGVTRQRVISLLRDAGIKVHERSLRWRTSSRPTRCSRPATTPRWRPSPASNSSSLQPGPIMQKARDLYWDYALGGR